MMTRDGVFMDQDPAAPEADQTGWADIAEGYRQMSADIEHELEAEEWTEALVGDVSDVDKETVND
jgi:hypothetical protein